jgi:hypothetical protein
MRRRRSRGMTPGDCSDVVMRSAPHPSFVRLDPRRYVRNSYELRKADATDWRYAAGFPSVDWENLTLAEFKRLWGEQAILLNPPAGFMREAR